MSIYLIVFLDVLSLHKTLQTTTKLGEIPEVIDLDSIGEENITSNNNTNVEGDQKSSSYIVQYTLSQYKAHVSPSQETNTGFSIPKTTTTEIVDSSWVNLAIRDIGYYLRSYKFREYDRRYNAKPPKTLGQYFLAFPKPPLRSLHWEVNKYCDVSFYQCIKYLGSKIENVILRREDDTVYVSNDMNWKLVGNSKEINAIDAECKNLSKVEFWDATPFEGPLERFQWRTTASYFMCWYSMKEEPSLMHFNESCDNFAQCLSEEFGFSNGDPRANDAYPFFCALYSFCPDPCCPVRHINYYNECFSSDINPCLKENNDEPTKQRCKMKRNENIDFTDIVLNRFNVSCNCQNPGYVWSSRYGICVDIDECVLGKHSCKKDLEICVNTNGSYICACNWGYIWNNTINQCGPSEVLNILKREKAFREQITEKPEVTLSIFKMISNLLTNSCTHSLNEALLYVFTFYVINIFKYIYSF